MRAPTPIPQEGNVQIDARVLRNQRVDERYSLYVPVLVLGKRRKGRREQDHGS
jgi:hypothetical protein